MAEVPAREEMSGVLESTIELAEDRLGKDEVRKLSEVMSSFCLELKDIDSCYYVTFDPAGETSFSLEDPGGLPMLTISTTSETFHKMATGAANPAVEFAMRKVKISGVPVPKLTKVGGNLIDSLFQCYRTALGEEG
jgi:putative sterol carrier protein